MNFKTGVMAATLALSSMGSHAQTITKTTTRTLTKSSTVTNTVKQTLVHKGDTLKFSDALKAFALGTEDSAKVAKDKVSAKFGIHYLGAENLSSPAGGFHLDVNKKNTSIMLEGDFGRKPGHSIGLIKGHVGYEYPLGKGFAAGGDVGINGKVRRINGDNGGAIAPDAAASVSYKFKSNSGFGVNARGRVGGAINFEHDNTVYTHKRSDVIGDLKVGVDYKKAGLNVTGGKDVHKGKFVQVGATYNF